MKPQVQVIVGTVGSGKSHYSRNCARAGAVVVSDDAIVLAVHGGDYSLYDKGLKNLYKSTENHLLTTALALNRPVVVDRGLNLTRQSRSRWVALARSLDCPVMAVEFPMESPHHHAQRRVNSDDRGASYEEWLRIATHHQSVYQPVYPEEGFARVVPATWEFVKGGGVYGID